MTWEEFCDRANSEQTWDDVMICRLVGLLSTYEPFADKHPGEAFDYVASSIDDSEFAARRSETGD